MPKQKCSNGKWKIGESGKCMYKSEASASRAEKGYYASKKVKKLKKSS